MKPTADSAVLRSHGLHRFFRGRMLRLLGVGCLLGAMALQGLAYFPDCSRPLRVHRLKMEDATFEEAVQCLRVTTRLEDTDRDPKGVNFVIKDPHNRIDKRRRLSLEVYDVTLADVEKVIGAFYGVKVKVEPYAVVFEPKSSSESMVTRYFKVPPDFRSSANLGR